MSAIRNPKSEIVVVGGSLGGLRALQVVLGGLPQTFALPLVAVLHRDRDSDETLAALLQQGVALTVVEAEDKQPIRRGRVYLAPPDYHLLIEMEDKISNHPSTSLRESPTTQPPNYPTIQLSHHFALSTDAPVNYARPSIDVLFESAADAYGDGVIGIILTGANEDGARGLAAIKARGGLTIAQDPATAE
ncbi:MAG: chemotaxis protein CheB, partial [Chloroflexota bacterium]|nr:chemotaxis protein CheB [Chloroflexota bacterium]